MGGSTERTQAAERIMVRFAERTGLTSGRPTRRYLWTDAFAVCNFLGLARATGKSRHVELALRLMDVVHGVLGRHRQDDARSGWLSGQPEADGTRHPTAGGLRIGKRLPERGVDEPFDAELEWDRDGQYFHYLTKWMHALDQVSRYTANPRFNVWARELAKAAHDAFVQEPSLGSGPPHMVWKMSVDLKRPLVPSMGQHDALDGFVTLRQLRATASSLPGAPAEPSLARETMRFAEMVDMGHLATVDPLGLGSLLVDACRITQFQRPGERADDDLLHALLAAAAQGIRGFGAGPDLGRAAEKRLAFRELGMSIGLKAIRLMREQAGGNRDFLALLGPLERYVPLGDAIDAFWLTPRHQSVPTWFDHLDINEVMLATSLVPEGCLLLSMPATR